MPSTFQQAQVMSLRTHLGISMSLLLQPLQDSESMFCPLTADRRIRGGRIGVQIGLGQIKSNADISPRRRIHRVTFHFQFF